MIILKSVTGYDLELIRKGESHSVFYNMSKKEYIVVYGLTHLDNGEICWSDGTYFDDKEKAIKCFNKKDKEIQFWRD